MPHLATTCELVIRLRRSGSITISVFTGVRFAQGTRPAGSIRQRLASVVDGSIQAGWLLHWPTTSTVPRNRARRWLR